MTLRQVLITVILLPGILYGQSSRTSNLGSLGYYMTAYPNIFVGTINSATKSQIKIGVEDWIKKGKTRRFTMYLRHYRIPKGENILSFLGLEIDQKYIFIGGTANRSYMPSPLRYPEHRFKIVNDSLFIPSTLLRMIPSLQSIDTEQEVTFGDPIIKTGYKIAVSDFKVIYETLSSCYSWKRTKKWNSARCLDKIENPNKASSPLINGFLTELEKSWMKAHCK